MRRPLSSIRVLDLSRVRSGPTAVRQLADWGADVIPSPYFDPLRAVGQPFRLSAAESGVRLRPPEHGEHTDDILATLGYSAEAIGEALVTQCFDSADYREGRHAFLEKRTPVFTGR
jgi:crotonobetainyl-CoA:carnitine CoA-transferase CaiB-like acyl-CoA transferase